MLRFSIANQLINDTTFFFSALLSGFLFCIFFSKSFKVFETSTYEAVQKIHDSHVSRLGGLGIFISIGIYSCFMSNGLLFNLLFCALPMFIVALIEDVRHNIKPLIRMAAILLSAVIFIIPLYQNNLMPLIEIPIIGSYLNGTWILAVLLIISISGVVNGVNMIDGANGLSSFAILTILISISFIALNQSDYHILSASLITIAVILGFILVNYPWGKIFLGDSGAYFLGFSVSILTIQLYARNAELPFWGAILILFYPVMEVLFSFTRKALVQRKTPFSPDTEHLHLKLFFMLKKSIKVNWVANSFVTPCLVLIWLVPPLLSIISFQNVVSIWIGVFLSSIIYMGIYFALPVNSMSKKGK